MHCETLDFARSRAPGRMSASSSLHVVDYEPFIRAQRDALFAARESRRLAWGTLKRKGDVEASSSLSAPAGDRRVAKLQEVLDGYDGFVRSNAQKRFHDEFMKAALPHIYGSAEFERHRDRILREHKMDRVRYECLVCTPRRFGKTTSVRRRRRRAPLAAADDARARTRPSLTRRSPSSLLRSRAQVSMFCAALLATCPDMWISVFSTGQRASSALLDQCTKFFRMLPDDEFCLGGDERILKKNNEQLFTRGRTPDDVRRMFSYPSTVSGLKGVGGRVIIMEEAAQMDEQVFKARATISNPLRTPAARVHSRALPVSRARARAGGDPAPDGGQRYGAHRHQHAARLDQLLQRALADEAPGRH